MGNAEMRAANAFWHDDEFVDSRHEITIADLRHLVIARKLLLTALFEPPGMGCHDFMTSRKKWLAYERDLYPSD